MNTHHTIPVETVILSGSIPARSPRAFTSKQRDTTAVKFSGVRAQAVLSSGKSASVNDTMHR